MFSFNSDSSMNNTFGAKFAPAASFCANHAVIMSAAVIAVLIFVISVLVRLIAAASIISVISVIIISVISIINILNNINQAKPMNI